MQEIQATEQAQRTFPEGFHISSRWIFLGVAALSLVLLGLLPPLISVNRYQHRISTSIGTSLGRPVHFDQVSLNLLPLPGLTITNFVVEEDPAFGTEPIIRANTVKATLRVSSLWRRRVEFSRISFIEPSVNLVHDGRGRWNVEGILLQAASIETAPTIQPEAGSTPRFPYIEATGARLNLKQGVEKTPFSVAEADFALWLPDPRAWKMRIQGRPVRTDTSVSDTGSLQVEATLGRAGSLEKASLDLQAAWRGAPLGEVSRLLSARDLGLRGDMTASANVHGDLSHNLLETHLQISRLRRSDFVPEQAVSLDLECSGTATRMFHAIADLRCRWPIPDADGATLALAGSVPDLLQPNSADVQIGTSRVPAGVLLSWLRVASSRIPPSLSATGLLSGSVSHSTEDQPAWVGQATIPELRLSGAGLDPVPLVIAGIFLHSSGRRVDARSSGRPAPSPAATVVLSPVALPLGGRDAAVLEASADADGYSLHLSGMVLLSRLVALGAAVPQIGEGLSSVLPTGETTDPVRLDLSAHRQWSGAQVWTDNLAHARPLPPRRNRFGHRSRPPSPRVSGKVPFVRALQRVDRIKYAID